VDAQGCLLKISPETRRLNLLPWLSDLRLVSAMFCITAALWVVGCTGGSSSPPPPPPPSNPVPSLAAGSLNPSSVSAGGPGFTLTVTGSNFVSSSVVQLNGSPRATTYTSSSSLNAAITVGDIANIGTASITVVTPAPGGGSSDALTLPIVNPLPTLTSLDPGMVIEGTAAFTLTVSGSNLISSSVVQWNGSARATTYVSSTTVQAAISSADIATAGTASVTVINPAPGGGTSNALILNIDNPVPVLGSINPSAVLAGTGAFTLSLTGSNFISSSAVQWNGSARPTTFVSSTQLRAAIPSADIALPGAADVTVFNPTPGGGSSSALPILVTAIAVKQVTGISMPNYMAWDPSRGTLYVSVASTDPSIPNTIVPVNPVTAVAGTPVAAGNNPRLVSISSDYSYLWAGLDGDGAVGRFRLPGLTKDISFKLPLNFKNNPQQALSLEADPYSPHTLAVIPVNSSDSENGNGVYIYDDATQRPTTIPGYPGGPEIDWIQWGPNGSTIYGNDTITTPTPGTATLSVNTSGVSFGSYNGANAGPFRTTAFDRSTGVLYSDIRAFNPATGSLIGLFNVSGQNQCVSDAALGRYFCIRSDAAPALPELWIFDLNSYALLDRYYFASADGRSISPLSGTPVQLLRWGKAGLAIVTETAPFAGDGGLFLIDGLAINPNSPPDFPSGASTPTLSYSSITSMLPFQATVGSGDVTVSLTGNNFTPFSSVCINNGCSASSLPSLSTTFVNSKQLNFIIPSSALSTPALLPMMVYDSLSGLFSTNSLTFAVNSAPGGSETSQVTAVGLDGLSMTYDSHSALLYIGTADYDSIHPNSIVALDPATGSISNVQVVGSNPDLLSVSANGQFLYMGFASTTNMTQLEIPSLGAPLTWALNNPLTSAVYWAGDLRAAPQNPHTVAVTLLDLTTQPTLTGGVVIYEDEVLQPNYVPGWGLSQVVFSTLAWGSSDPILTGASVSSPLSELQVTATGVSLVSTGTAIFNNGFGQIHSDFGNGLIYSDSGNVANPLTQAVVGNYKASGLVAPDSTLNRVFILGQTAAQANTNNYTI
jgi:hypothetical protein